MLWSVVAPEMLRPVGAQLPVGMPRGRRGGGGSLGILITHTHEGG